MATNGKKFAHATLTISGPCRVLRSFTAPKSAGPGDAETTQKWWDLSMKWWISWI